MAPARDAMSTLQQPCPLHNSSFIKRRKTQSLLQLVSVVAFASLKRKGMREKTVMRRRLLNTKCQTPHGKGMREKETVPFINDVASQAA